MGMEQGNTRTDTNAVSFAGHDYSYSDISQRMTNYEPANPYRAMISPQLFRSDTIEYSQMGTNLDFGTMGIYYPFSALVRNNIVTPLIKNTTAYDSASGAYYTYSWSLDSAGVGATLFGTSRVGTGITGTFNGEFSELSTAAQYVKQGGSCVGGFGEADGDELATYLPGGFSVTSIDAGGASSTYTTIRTAREIMAANGALFIDAVIPASKTAAYLIEAANTEAFSPITPYTVYNRNNDGR
jgi:hypothetical protein